MEFTHGCNLFALALDVVAEIFLHPTHRYDCVIAQCLDHLQW